MSAAAMSVLADAAGLVGAAAGVAMGVVEEIDHIVIELGGRNCMFAFCNGKAAAKNTRECIAFVCLRARRDCWDDTRKYSADDKYFHTASMPTFVSEKTERNTITVSFATVAGVVRHLIGGADANVVADALKSAAGNIMDATNASTGPARLLIDQLGPRKALFVGVRAEDFRLIQDAKLELHRAQEAAFHADDTLKSNVDALCNHVVQCSDSKHTVTQLDAYAITLRLELREALMEIARKANTTVNLDTVKFVVTAPPQYNDDILTFLNRAMRRALTAASAAELEVERAVCPTLATLLERALRVDDPKHIDYTRVLMPFESDCAMAWLRMAMDDADRDRIAKDERANLLLVVDFGASTVTTSCYTPTFSGFGNGRRLTGFDIACAPCVSRTGSERINAVIWDTLVVPLLHALQAHATTPDIAAALRAAPAGRLLRDAVRQLKHEADNVNPQLKLDDLFEWFAAHTTVLQPATTFANAFNTMVSTAALVLHDASVVPLSGRVELKHTALPNGMVARRMIVHNPLIEQIMSLMLHHEETQWSMYKDAAIAHYRAVHRLKAAPHVFGFVVLGESAESEFIQRRIAHALGMGRDQEITMSVRNRKRAVTCGGAWLASRATSDKRTFKHVPNTLLVTMMEDARGIADETEPLYLHMRDDPAHRMNYLQLVAAAREVVQPRKGAKKPRGGRGGAKLLTLGIPVVSARYLRAWDRVQVPFNFGPTDGAVATFKMYRSEQEAPPDIDGVPQARFLFSDAELAPGAGMFAAIKKSAVDSLLDVKFVKGADNDMAASAFITYNPTTDRCELGAITGHGVTQHNNNKPNGASVDAGLTLTHYKKELASLLAADDAAHKPVVSLVQYDDDDEDDDEEIVDVPAVHIKPSKPAAAFASSAHAADDVADDTDSEDDTKAAAAAPDVASLLRQLAHYKKKEAAQKAVAAAAQQVHAYADSFIGEDADIPVSRKRGRSSKGARKN